MFLQPRLEWEFGHLQAILLTGPCSPGPNSAPLAVTLAGGYGVMSMWGSYRPIKAAVRVPEGRPRWTGHRQMKAGRWIKVQRFSFPTETFKVHKTKAELTLWNFKDKWQITDDHFSPQPTFNGDSWFSVCTECLTSLGTNPHRIIQTEPAEVC